jgi:hypothetical protein
MSELSPLCAAKRILIWRPIGGDVTFMRQPALCGLFQKYSRLPASRSAKSSIADMIACISM